MRRAVRPRNGANHREFALMYLLGGGNVQGADNAHQRARKEHKFNESQRNGRD
jgi:hypothetical protein